MSDLTMGHGGRFWGLPEQTTKQMC